MSLKHGLLGLLNYGAMTGYALDKAFKASLSFFWQAKTSQIYRELDAMEQCGWLTSQRVLQTEKPNKRVYSLTERGKAELLDWLAQPEGDIEGAMRVKNAFLMRVFFAGETDLAQSLDLLRAYRDRCVESKQALAAAFASSAEYSQMLEDAQKAKFWTLSIRYGASFYDASIEWAEQAIAALEGKAP